MSDYLYVFFYLFSQINPLKFVLLNIIFVFSYFLI